MRTQSSHQVTDAIPDIEKQQRSADDATEESRVNDANIVDWDSDKDPEKPMNWSIKKKWTNGGLLAGMTLVT